MALLIKSKEKTMTEEKKIAPEKKQNTKKSNVKKEIAVPKLSSVKVERSSEDQFSEIMKLAMNPDFPVEKLQAIIALKNNEEDREIIKQKKFAEKLFQEDFAKMQQEFEPVKKTKENKKYGSKYAGISDLQRQYGPVIARHGFAYDFAEPVFNEDGSVDCCFILMKHGHARKTTVKMPKFEPDVSSSGKGIMNPMQAVGTQLSYGNRYAMKAGLGVTEEEDDTDGNFTFEDGVYYSESIQNIKAENTIEGCLQVAKEEIAKLGNDPYGEDLLKRIYGERKAAIEKMTGGKK